MAMRFKVQRDHTFCGKQHKRGDVVDLDNSDRVVQMCEQRFLLALGDEPIPSAPPSESAVVRNIRQPRKGA